jgi:hypothetical protein
VIIAKKEVAVVLSDEGRQVLQMAAVTLPDEGAVAMFVQDTDDLGLWVKAERSDGDHLLLIRWEDVLAIDILPSEPKSVGIKA